MGIGNGFGHKWVGWEWVRLGLVVRLSGFVPVEALPMYKRALAGRVVRVCVVVCRRSSDLERE